MREPTSGPPRRAARVLLLDGKGRVLLVRSGDHDAPDVIWWELPGGGIDPGEQTAQAASRELLEETGYLDVDIGPPIGSLRWTWEFTNRSHEQIDTVHVAFLRSARRQEPRLGEGEIAQPAWMDRLQLEAAAADVSVPLVPHNLGDVVDWLLASDDRPRPALRPPPWWPLAHPGVRAEPPAGAA